VLYSQNVSLIADELAIVWLLKDQEDTGQNLASSISLIAIVIFLSHN